MENNPITALVKSNSALVRVSNQIAVTTRLLEAADPFLIPYRKGDKWGFCDRDKRIVIDCVYDEVAFFSEGLAAVNFNSKFGYIDNVGKLVILPSFEKAYSFNSCGLAEVYLNGENMLIDKSGKAEYSFVNVTIHDLRNSYEIWDENFITLGLINRFGKMTLSPPYELFGWSSVEGLLLAKNDNGKYGFCDDQGHIVIPFNYEMARQFQEGLSCVCDVNNKWGFIDVDNKVVVEFIYENAESFKRNGTAAVNLNGKWGYIDKDGIQTTSLIYDKIQCFPGELDAVNLNNQWGLLNTKSNEVILSCVYKQINYAGSIKSRYSHTSSSFVFDEEEYESELKFYNVKIGSKWGMVDQNLNLIFEFIYDTIGSWSEGFVALRIDDKWGFGNLLGDVVISLQYKWVESFVNGMTYVGNSAKYGVIDIVGREILPFGEHYGDMLDNGFGSIKNDTGQVVFYFDNLGVQFFED